MLTLLALIKLAYNIIIIGGEMLLGRPNAKYCFVRVARLFASLASALVRKIRTVIAARATLAFLFAHAAAFVAGVFNSLAQSARLSRRF